MTNQIRKIYRQAIFTAVAFFSTLGLLGPFFNQTIGAIGIVGIVALTVMVGILPVYKKFKDKKGYVTYS